MVTAGDQGGVSANQFWVASQEMLTNHNCVEAFWVGNLKNKDLQVSFVISVHLYI